jgi:hypothetical protein
MRIQITIHFRITTLDAAEAFLAELRAEGRNGFVLTLSDDYHEVREIA